MLTAYLARLPPFSRRCRPQIADHVTVPGGQHVPRCHSSEGPIRVSVAVYPELDLRAGACVVAVVAHD